MSTHPVNPDDPGPAAEEDVREPPLPETHGPREQFPRKGDVLDPDPSVSNK